MINIQKYNRWQAASAHLALSFIIFSGLLALILFVWYPGVFFHFGAVDGIKIVAGVDLVLGPLLTLIIFNKNKSVKLIAIDLLVIWLVQLIALGAGIRVVYMERPVVQVLSDDGYIYIHTASEFSQANITTDFESPSTKTIPFFFINVPEDKQEATNYKLKSEFAGISYTLRKEDYLPLYEVSKEKLEKRLSKLTKQGDNNCYDVNFESLHLFGTGCFEITKGLTTITDK